REAAVDVAALPDNLQALLGARLDQLDPGARAVLERGAIEGEVFHRGAVIELSAVEARPVVPALLAALTGKDLVRPAAASFVNEAGFRFKHILVRDAAYQATAKQVRAGLHERYARWLECVAGDRVTEYAEILGYHLEQSFRYRLELGPADAGADALAAPAAGELSAAGVPARGPDDRGGALRR